MLCHTTISFHNITYVSATQVQRILRISVKASYVHEKSIVVTTVVKIPFGISDFSGDLQLNIGSSDMRFNVSKHTSNFFS